MNNRELQEDAFQKLNTNYGGIATRQGQTQGELTKTSLNIKGIDDEIVKLNNGKIPNEDNIMTFSMLLNLVEASNADNKELLWKFVKKYKKNISENNHPIFDKLIDYAIKYFNDIIKLQKNRAPTTSLGHLEALSLA